MYASWRWVASNSASTVEGNVQLESCHAHSTGLVGTVKLRSGTMRSLHVCFVTVNQWRHPAAVSVPCVPLPSWEVACPCGPDRCMLGVVLTLADCHSSRPHKGARSVPTALPDEAQNLRCFRFAAGYRAADFDVCLQCTCCHAGRARAKGDSAAESGCNEPAADEEEGGHGMATAVCALTGMCLLALRSYMVPHSQGILLTRILYQCTKSRLYLCVQQHAGEMQI